MAYEAVPTHSVVTVPPGLDHRFRFAKEIDGFVIAVLTSHLKMIPDDRGSLKGWHAKPDLTPLDMENEDAVHMAQPLRRRGAEFASRRSGRTDLFEVYLATGLQLTSGLSREGPEGEAATDENRAATEMPSDLVQRHFRSHLPAACYAGVLGISASHLNRIVKGTTDHGMHELIARKVIDESRREWSLP